jgi:hypothetical protein
MLIELPFQKDLMPSLIFMALAQSKIPWYLLCRDPESMS